MIRWWRCIQCLPKVPRLSARFECPPSSKEDQHDRRSAGGVWAGFTLVLHGCSWLTEPNVYVNKQFDTKLKPAGKLAIVPLPRLGPSLPCTGKCPPLEQVTDQSFQKSFEGFPGEVRTVPMATTRTFFEGKPDLLNKLIGIKWSTQDLRNDPGLRKILSGEELASIREELGNANLLLVPARFDLIPHLGTVVGYSEFQLYDLDSGSMIFSSSRNMSVNRAEEADRGLMALVLISHGKSDFERLYLHHDAAGN